MLAIANLSFSAHFMVHGLIRKLKYEMFSIRKKINKLSLDLHAQLQSLFRKYKQP